MSYVLVVPSGNATGSGPTVLRARQVIGEELGWWGDYRVSTEVSLSPEASSSVVVDELQDDDEGMAALDGAYVYVRTGNQAGAQRRIVRDRFDGSLGAMIVGRIFNAPLEVGDRVEISYPLPVRRHVDRKGLIDLLEEAADRMVVDARIALEGTGSTGISLADFPWLHAYEQTRGVYDSRRSFSATEPTLLSPYAYNLAQDGADVTLQTSVTYSSGEAFELAVVAPGNRLLNDGTAWGYFDPHTLVDTADDTWQLACPEHWIRAFGVTKGLQHLITLTMRDRTITDEAVRQRMVADHQRRLPTYARAAARIVQNEFSQQLQEVTNGLVTTANTTQNVWSSPRSSWGSGWPA